MGFILRQALEIKPKQWGRDKREDTHLQIGDQGSFQEARVRGVWWIEISHQQLLLSLYFCRRWILREMPGSILYKIRISGSERTELGRASPHSKKQTGLAGLKASWSRKALDDSFEKDFPDSEVAVPLFQLQRKKGVAFCFERQACYTRLLASMIELETSPRGRAQRKGESEGGTCNVPTREIGNST